MSLLLQKSAEEKIYPQKRRENNSPAPAQKTALEGKPPAVLCGSDALKNLNRSCYEDYQY